MFPYEGVGKEGLAYIFRANELKLRQTKLQSHGCPNRVPVINRVPIQEPLLTATAQLRCMTTTHYNPNIKIHTGNNNNKKREAQYANKTDKLARSVPTAAGKQTEGLA